VIGGDVVIIGWYEMEIICFHYFGWFYGGGEGIKWAVSGRGCAIGECGRDDGFD
jgi:hypothetical protein